MTEPKPINELLSSAGGGRHSGQHVPDEPALSERDQLILELVEVGVSVRKAESLAIRYPVQSIRQQLDWLPYRSARRPASMIIAAIENDYSEPAYAD